MRIKASIITGEMIGGEIRDMLQCIHTYGKLSRKWCKLPHSPQAFWALYITDPFMK